jgi:hypothetical protein
MQRGCDLPRELAALEMTQPTGKSCTKLALHIFFAGDCEDTNVQRNGWEVQLIHCQIELNLTGFQKA